MSNLDDNQINSLLADLYSDDHYIRINAIHQSGETADELCLKGLRKQLKYITREHQSLIIATWKLKKKLGIK
jgi:hypothetical protein